MRAGGGFSLVELLLLLAIISIVAAVAIPSLMLSRQAANEAGAVQSCRTIASAEKAYAAAHGNSFADLSTLVREGLLDGRYEPGSTAHGYSFAPGDVAGTSLDGAPPESFGFIASPAPGSGRFLFSVGPDEIVRYQGIAEGHSLPPGIGPGDPVTAEEP